MTQKQMAEDRARSADKSSPEHDHRVLRAKLSVLCALCSVIFLGAGSQVVASKAALSTVSPHATQIGLRVLQRGGNAIDAAVAVAFALAVVHPQAGNIGGGGFLMYYDASTHSAWTLDFREVAPGAATRDMFAKLPEDAPRVGPLAAGVPGTVAGLEAMHTRFGTRPWKELLAPAIGLARTGFATDSRLAADLAAARETRKIDRFTSTAALLYPDGKPLAPGTTLIQSDLAATLDRIANHGARDFYRGETAQRIVKAVHANGGLISLRDLREYEPVWRAPITIRFREYEIYALPPPSAGGLVIGEALNILSGFDLEAAGFQTPRSIHLQVEAERRAYIDRNRYLGDPDATRIPYRELLSADRALQWRRTIGARMTATTSLVDPSAAGAEGNHTTHFTIADAAGNIVALTTTLNDNFGGGFVVPGCGFLLNSEMDDFSTAPGRPNRYGIIQGRANDIEPHKRMASSMSPLIVMKDKRPILALGSRGGPTIPTTLLQVVLNVIVYKKSLYDAIEAPRYHHQSMPDQIDYERGRGVQATIDALNVMGHAVVSRDAIGDVHALQFQRGSIIAVADSRDNGSAGGI
jgi:gamma-glutamyltranspeptidase/glutathione hydrolase